MTELKRYDDTDCEYSMFVSYAHADDESNDWWITTLKDAIFARMGQLPKAIPRKEIHFSGENGPTSGTLGSELEANVERSFAMLLVIGKQYAYSSWCEKELKLFQKHFPNGTKSRLYIAVMGDEFLQYVTTGDNWKTIVAPDQLYVSMYHSDKPNKPFEHRLTGGAKGLPPDFRNAAYKIADRWISQIEADWTKSTEDSTDKNFALASGKTAAHRKPTSAGDVLRVAIAPYGPSFDPAADRQPIEALKQTLLQAGAEVSVISRDLLLTYNPSNGSPLRQKLTSVDILIAPLLNESPLRPDMAGGHASILIKEWTALQKQSRLLVWYRPDAIDVAPIDVAETLHLEVFKSLAPVCTSPQAVVNLLFGAGTSDVIKVYIERHPVVPIYRLKDAIEKAWEALQLQQGTKRPSLRCMPLKFDQLDEIPKDVGAIILLDAWGHSPGKSLRARQTEIEKYFPKNEACYPGLVALVFNPPPPDAKPNHEWGDVTFLRSDGPPPGLDLEDESTYWLHDFLNEIWTQHQKIQLQKPN